jgi:hypothetical protein
MSKLKTEMSKLRKNPWQAKITIDESYKHKASN